MSNPNPTLHRTLYLALDFDGVLYHAGIGPNRQQLELLHAEGQQASVASVEQGVPRSRPKSHWMDGEGRLFDRLDQLEALVDQLQAQQRFAAIRIVYATSWRVLVPGLAGGTSRASHVHGPWPFLRGAAP